MECRREIDEGYGTGKTKASEEPVSPKFNDGNQNISLAVVLQSQMGLSRLLLVSVKTLLGCSNAHNNSRF